MLTYVDQTSPQDVASTRRHCACSRHDDNINCDVLGTLTCELAFTRLSLSANCFFLVH